VRLRKQYLAGQYQQREERKASFHVYIFHNLGAKIQKNLHTCKKKCNFAADFTEK
jgi:hypothetical protein